LIKWGLFSSKFIHSALHSNALFISKEAIVKKEKKGEKKGGEGGSDI